MVDRSPHRFRRSSSSPGAIVGRSSVSLSPEGHNIYYSDEAGGGASGVTELAADAVMCRAFGSGLHLQILHRPTRFMIKAFDRYGRALIRGGTPFSVVIRGPAAGVPALRDLKNGTYECDWQTPISGTYSISVTIKGI